MMPRCGWYHRDLIRCRGVCRGVEEPAMARGAQALIDISRAGAREGSERDRGAIARLWHVLSDKTTGTVHGMACTVRAQHPLHPKRRPASYIVVGGGGGGRYLVPAIPGADWEGSAGRCSLGGKNGCALAPTHMSRNGRVAVPSRSVSMRWIHESLATQSALVAAARRFRPGDRRVFVVYVIMNATP